ncbi:LITAF domain-containing protein-like isoform X2 [Dunckerocampus dactyliophorus]|nr:LITAF domain-containing protein-like isoform X2 [Dunckerocampus dactyliophorus]XP_054614528.1 LITAF domain-containing protein-like isoform X2 [Dunckerocampus dactyliophorus]XP_054614529.1 LITAF domain-containing protein-like isoform X2 [Dunckerocampus dactyliophorus]XP_054614530.1 LITAF domain-containing protein-like isoform X2 [Dunckerocampus dactyliophorus]XP_054614531.1 LITAF domain-containing protein-like isoform X2 [Dunckerocampus dactyliophorus]XP_054614532.1 LITAF domain-containing p
MEKGYPEHEPAPSYTGPPMNPSSLAPQPGLYPPPHAGAPYVAYQGGSAATVTHVVVNAKLQDAPGQERCPRCQQMVLTQVERKAGLMTWLICGGMAFIGCCLCCWVPFVVDSCKDVQHNCPNCNNVIYLYKRL